MHYTRLEGGIIKLTRLKQVTKDPLLNMLGFGFYVMGNSNNISAETPEEEFKRYYFTGIFMVDIIVNI